MANANILINGGFEDGPTGQISSPIPGWSSWGGSGWHHDDAGQTLDTKAIKFWWDDAGLWQDFAVTGGTNYSISAETLSPANDPLNLWNGLIKVEYYDRAREYDVRVVQPDPAVPPSQPCSSATADGDLELTYLLALL